MIRDFGVLLAIGIVVLVVVGIVVPASALGIREYKKRTEVRPESFVEKIVVKLGSLPTSWGLPLLIVSALLFFGGVLVEDRAKIESDPIKWVDQSSQVVKDIEQLEEDTGFSSTLGILVAANNIYDQNVIDLVWDFTLDAEERGDVVSTSSLVNTMGKIIMIEGATPISPTSADVAASVEQMPEDIQKALLRAPDDPTGTQLNLRLAPASLEERAVLVRELEADLQSRIDALDLPADSVLLVDLPEGQDPVRATPAGLATVGIGLLENLSANRANLTYLALSLAALFLVLRCRSLTRGLLALGSRAARRGRLVVDRRAVRGAVEPADDGERATGDRHLRGVLRADPRALSRGATARVGSGGGGRARSETNRPGVLHVCRRDDLWLRGAHRIGTATAA